MKMYEVRLQACDGSTVVNVLLTKEQTRTLSKIDKLIFEAYDAGDNYKPSCYPRLSWRESKASIEGVEDDF